MVLFGCGAILMRGAGCTFNDMVDKDIDIKVSVQQSLLVSFVKCSQQTGSKDTHAPYCIRDADTKPRCCIFRSAVGRRSGSVIIIE
jgi:hypothetical protein